MAINLSTALLDTPLGTMRAVVRDAKVCDLDFVALWPTKLRRLRRRFGEIHLREDAALPAIAAAIADYFSGDCTAIDSVEVDPGGTPFQREVWAALRRIPSGTTLSYAEMARQLKRPRAFRAVGAANGQNPISVVIPCHRLIGSDGSLTGYASGTDRKRWLLTHEAAARDA